MAQRQAVSAKLMWNESVLDLQTFDSGFTKREFVVTTEDQYPQDVKFEAVKDRISMLDNLQPGQTVTVSFNVRGNEYQGRYYVNLQAWRVQAEAEGAAQEGASASAGGSGSYDIPESADGEAEDFPF